VSPNQDGAEPSLPFLIERSGQLKRDLVTFACSPRYERQLQRLMLEAGQLGRELGEVEAIGVIDRFALRHRLPDGKAVLDRFVASRPDRRGLRDAGIARDQAQSGEGQGDEWQDDGQAGWITARV
jgi:hypothetical protein